MTHEINIQNQIQNNQPPQRLDISNKSSQFGFETMSVYLNRTLSMMSGNLASPTHENSTVLDRSLHNNAYENSPLQIFVRAKKKINDIFGEIEEYVVETANFMNGKYIHGAHAKCMNRLYSTNCIYSNRFLFFFGLT